ncbi:MAG: YggS family pyridoxal phosphate-dependent enzyme [Planctomycetota bacterium]|nr:YggS family pyridoxal phosphate-dependent enzyme [Planctomycetota bacterium]
MPDIAANLAKVRERIAAACRRSGRDPSEVTLTAVVKTVTPKEISELYHLGIRDFGENRVAIGLEHKAALELPGARWHMIGHLQKNKAAKLIRGGFGFIHSVESIRLLDILDREAGEAGSRLGVLLEINISGEEVKYGVSPGEALELARLAAGKENLDLLGLMTMAPLSDNPEAARPVFRKLAETRKIVEAGLGIRLPHLSMGMSGDLEPAVEEGATLVRVGAALFA